MIFALLLLASPGLLERGEHLYRQHQFEQARAVFQKLVQQQPSARQGRLWLGYSELALGNYKAAIRVLEPLEPAFGADVEFLFSLSEAYTRQARELSNRIAELGSQSARAHQLLAYRYRAEGNPRSAESELRKAIGLRPKVTGLHLDLAELLWEQQRRDEASQALAAELQIQPEDFLSNLRMGQYLLLQRQWDQALGPLTIAARHRIYPEAFQLLAYAHQRRSDPAQARAVVKAALNLFPGEQALTEMLTQFGTGPAEAWQFQPLHAKARAKPGAEPVSEDDLFLLSQHYSERGLLLAEKLEQVAPESYRARQLKGIAAEYAGKWTEAEAYYREVVKAKPELPGVYAALGLVLIAQGRDEEGAVQLRTELKLEAKNHLALFQLGTVLLRKGEMPDALRLLAEAQQLRPQFVPGLWELGKALLQARRPAEAVKHLETVVSKEPEHPSAHFLLYRALLAVGDKDAAAAHLKLHQQIMRQRAPADSAGMN